MNASRQPGRPGKAPDEDEPWRGILQALAEARSRAEGDEEVGLIVLALPLAEAEVQLASIGASGMKEGGTASSLTFALRPPFDPHVAPGQGPATMSDMFQFPAWHLPEHAPWVVALMGGHTHAAYRSLTRELSCARGWFSHEAALRGDLARLLRRRWHLDVHVRDASG